MDDEIKAESGPEGQLDDGSVRVKHEDHGSASTLDRAKQSRSPSQSPGGQKAGSDGVSTPDIVHRPKTTRKGSSRAPARPAPLFNDLPNATADACEQFQVIPDCLYGSKSLGATEHDPLDCDCSPEFRDGTNYACGEDSECINRATKMECVDQECNCGEGCQNQRFQRQEYANVAVIKTEKKGFGLRAETDLQANDFIFEYIGEVINEPTFRRRMVQYDQEGIKHFYFMSLTRSEFVDATRKGNLGRFCNHSCNPNCYVDKWVVGSKLRMGIFAGRAIQAGEELVFNYNVDRYGADPQPCYCGEPNCIGFIGGKTQTQRATKLPDATIEALGIDDIDGWDTSVAKKPRKKKADEDDEEYVSSVQAKGLDEKGVTKVMAALMQCKEKWIAVKLLERIQNCEDDRVRNRVVQMHGYQILKTALTTFIADHNVVLQILDILYSLPRLTKNKISDAKIESTVEPLTKSEHLDVAERAAQLISEWSKLEVAYRIPRKKIEAGVSTNMTAATVNAYEERRNARAEEAHGKTSAALPDNTPKGPKSNVPQRSVPYFNQSRPVHRRPPPLPHGWFSAMNAQGATYYYYKGGQPTWRRPTAPAPVPHLTQPQPNASSKPKQEQKSIQDIIDSLTKGDTINSSRRSASQTPQQSATPEQQTKKEKWRSLPLDKQMKIYENTLSSQVKHVMDKYRGRLPKEDLKKFAKEVSKKLVASDYKHKRVDDPTNISEKQKSKVRKHVKDYFDRAVEKYTVHEKQKGASATQNRQKPEDTESGPLDLAKGEDDTVMTDDEAKDDVDSTPDSLQLKRKRDEDATISAAMTPTEPASIKRLKGNGGDDESETPSPPPPPPPPPYGEGADQDSVALQAAEEAEREKLREQEAALERENELNMRDFEREQGQDQQQNGSRGQEVLSH
ncbi:hypothetical protein Micbo1qcDRAFT_193511 [Microdochium bolleyi]|uniref:Histone-lysine N-methyltransferase, H3 lysine-36 specific n=1 Tax=Microdochium bolleyi TaxID=196109 RepID=A0A136JAV0_9PEZI|nr:hypothetical protein Micbo1qcDRAFT_193511 [Microdochium bolleyi]